MPIRESFAADEGAEAHRARRTQIAATWSSRRSCAAPTSSLDVGLDYLTLNRAAGTLSGGEAQRIRLASQLGSELSGVLYVLDEPSIGLHPRDHGR